MYSSLKSFPFVDVKTIDYRTELMNRRSRLITRMLIVVPLTFVGMNFPSYTLRIIEFVQLRLDPVEFC